MKRDIQGKFALHYDGYRLVRSLRLTDETWKALGIAAECNGLTRADYLEQIVRHNTLPSITRDESQILPCVIHGKTNPFNRVLHRMRGMKKGQPPYCPS